MSWENGWIKIFLWMQLTASKNVCYLKNIFIVASHFSTLTWKGSSFFAWSSLIRILFSGYLMVNALKVKFIFKMSSTQPFFRRFYLPIFIIVFHLASLITSQGTRCRIDSDCPVQTAGSRICCSKYGYCGPGKSYCDAGKKVYWIWLIYK